MYRTSSHEMLRGRVRQPSAFSWRVPRTSLGLTSRSCCSCCSTSELLRIKCDRISPFLLGLLDDGLLPPDILGIPIILSSAQMMPTLRYQYFDCYCVVMIRSNNTCAAAPACRCPWAWRQKMSFEKWAGKMRDHNATCRTGPLAATASLPTTLLGRPYLKKKEI